MPGYTRDPHPLSDTIGKEEHKWEMNGDEWLVKIDLKRFSCLLAGPMKRRHNFGHLFVRPRVSVGIRSWKSK